MSNMYMYEMQFNYMYEHKWFIHIKVTIPLRRTVTNEDRTTYDKCTQIIIVRSGYKTYNDVI